MPHTRPLPGTPTDNEVILELALALVQSLELVVHTVCYTMDAVTWCRLECCVVLGLDFEAASDSVVHYHLSNFLLGGHQIT